MKRELLLVTTALSRADFRDGFKKAAGPDGPEAGHGPSSAAPSPSSDLTHENAGAPSVPAEESEEVQGPLPVSLELIAQLVSNICWNGYAVDTSKLVIQPCLYKDGGVAISLTPAGIGEEGAPTDEDATAEAFNMYQTLIGFLTDLRAVQDEAQVHITPESLYIEAQDKMALHALFSNYLEDSEFGMLTPERVVFDPVLDEDIAGQQMREYFYMNASYGAQYDQEDRQSLLHFVEPKPFVSHQHYNANLMGAVHVKVGVSLDHLYKVIRQEDGHYDTASREDAFRFGGLH